MQTLFKKKNVSSYQPISDLRQITFYKVLNKIMEEISVLPELIPKTDAVLCLRACVCVCVCVCVRAYVCGCMYACMRVFKRVFVSVYVCLSPNFSLLHGHRG